MRPFAANACKRRLKADDAEMTPSEAFGETLAAHGVKTVFDVVGFTYMDALDLFSMADIDFIPTVYEPGTGPRQSE